jgi:hypothetical protein
VETLRSGGLGRPDAVRRRDRGGDDVPPLLSAYRSAACSPAGGSPVCDLVWESEEACRRSGDQITPI